MMEHQANNADSASEIRVSPLADDILSYTLFNYENLLRSSTELDLFRTKWFDYRQLTPLEATKRYMQAYHACYRRHYKANFDRSRADFVQSVDSERVMGVLEALLNAEPVPEGVMGTQHAKTVRKAQEAFTGCWRGRRCADGLGIPYEVYIDLAMEARLNYWNQPYMPKPIHLYSLMVVEKVSDRWDELQASRLYLSEDPAYMVQNYAGVQHQDDYHEWLFRQAELRSNPPAILAQFINDDTLPLDKVEARLDAETFERVSRHVHH